MSEVSSIAKSRRWPRFSLRTLLIAVTLLCIVLGTWIGRARRVDYAVEHFRRLGGDFGYHSQLLPDGHVSWDTPIRGPAWVRKLFGDNLFDSPAHLELGNKHPFKDPDLLPLGHLTELRQLFVGEQNEISGGGWVALEGLVRLQDLFVKQDKPRSTDAMLSHVAALKELESLQVTPSNFTADGVAHLKSLTKLRNLHLGQVMNLAAAMEHLKALPNLEGMSMGSGGGEEDLRGVGVQHAGQFPSLKWVQLRGKLTLAGYEQLLRMPNLEDLGLFWDTPDEVMPIVARVPKLSRLRLVSKRVSDAGLAALGEAAELQALELVLEQVDGSGLRSLVRLTKLERLHMMETPIVDESLQIIAQFLSLKKLTLSDTKVTPAAVQKLKSQRPDLTIFYQ